MLGKSKTMRCLAWAAVLSLISGTASAVELNVGDILVTDTAALQNMLFVINPDTGGQTQITPDATFANPSDVDVEPDGGVLVADEAIGQVYRVDPGTGAITALLDPALSVTKLGLVVSPTGKILVTGNTAPHSVREVHPDTGLTTVISEGGFLNQPRDLVVEADGNFLVLAVASGGRIVRVDPDTGGQTIVSEGGVLAGATGLALEDDGNVVVVSTANDAVTRIDTVTGIQTSVTPDGTFSDPRGITVDRDGSILVVDRGTDEVLRVDPVSGDVTLVSADGLLVKGTDVAVFGFGVRILSCLGFDPPLDAGPVSVTAEGVLRVRARLFDEIGLLVTDGLAAPPVLAIAFSHEQPAGLPTDATGQLRPPGKLRRVPALRGNQFLAPETGKKRWAQGLPTEQFTAPGSYRVTMVSGDKNEYVFEPTCEATYVVELPLM